MIVETPVFGSFDEEVDYISRPGGYAVVVDDHERIATVVTPKGRFLPGGAVEGDETSEQAAVRETLEETCLHIRVMRPLGRADEIVFKQSEGKYYRKECDFYLAEVVASDGTASEADHTLDWIKLDQARSAMTHQSQAWALDQIIS